MTTIHVDYNEVAKKTGYSVETVTNGYVASPIENGMIVIQKLDDLDFYDCGKFKDDVAAGRQAVLDGVKLFKCDIPELVDYYILDNEQNRSLLQEILQFVWTEDESEKGYVLEESGEGCEMESCRGTVYFVKWNDGDVTECCSCGMDDLSNGDWKIC